MLETVSEPEIWTKIGNRCRSKYSCAANTNACVFAGPANNHALVFALTNTHALVFASANTHVWSAFERHRTLRGLFRGLFIIENRQFF